MNYWTICELVTRHTGLDWKVASSTSHILINASTNNLLEQYIQFVRTLDSELLNNLWTRQAGLDWKIASSTSHILINASRRPLEVCRPLGVCRGVGLCVSLTLVTVTSVSLAAIPVSVSVNTGPLSQSPRSSVELKGVTLSFPPWRKVWVNEDNLTH